MDINGFLDTIIFGVSVRWIVGFVIKGILIFAFVKILTTIIKYLFNRSQKKQGRIVLEETKLGFIRQIIIAIIYIIGITGFLSLIPGMEKVSNSILASAGIVAAAVGLASQEALSNVIGGFFIIFSSPFKVGDFIKIDESIMGTVEEITLRHTILRNLENRMILIPNNKINSSTIINSSFGDTSTCSFIEIAVSYATDLNKAFEVMRDEIMKNPLVIDHRTKAEKKKGVPEVIIRVISLEDSAVTLRAWAWASTSWNAYVLKCESLKAVKERFDKENIEIPYPYYNQIIQQAKQS